MASDPTQADGDADLDDEDDEGGDWCITCGETFRYDDCGGYNPPCECGWHCRHCHERGTMRDDAYDYRDYFDV
jgi:hypothetical protein